jgi:hypothetical protein
MTSSADSMDVALVLQEVMQELKRNREMYEVLNESVKTLMESKHKTTRKSGNCSDRSFSSGTTTDSSCATKTKSSEKFKGGKNPAIETYHQNLTTNNTFWQNKPDIELVAFLATPNEMVAECQKKFPKLNEMR